MIGINFAIFVGLIVKLNQSIPPGGILGQAFVILQALRTVEAQTIGIIFG